MGLFIDRYRGLRWIHHSSEWVGYRAALSRFPDQHFSIMITCNCVGSMNPSSMVARIADIYLTDQFKKTEKPGSAPPASLADQDLSRFAGAYWSEKTGALRRFTVKDGKLVMDAPGGSVETIPLGNGEFEYHSDDSELKGEYVFRQSKPGGSYQLQAFEDGAQVWYNPVKDSDLRPDGLANYVGTYFNDELRATWQLVAERGKLIRQQWMNEDQELEPAFSDAFVGDLSEGEFLIHFSRNADGQVTGFQVSTEMIRPMTFVKVETGAKSDQRFGSE